MTAVVRLPDSLASHSSHPCVERPRRVGHPVPVEVLLKEGGSVAALVRERVDCLVAYDSRLDHQFAPRLEALCDQAERLPWRRELPGGPKPTLSEAVELVRRVVQALELVAKQDTDPAAAGFRSAFAELKRAHPRPRTLGSLGPALVAYASFVEAPSHADRLRSRGGYRPEMAARARALARLLEQWEAAREATRRARAQPSPRAKLLAEIDECLRMARAAAKAAYAYDDRALYRRFTSHYQRTSRRAARSRAGAGAPPASA